MNIPLDTHVLLWALGSPDRLRPHATRALEDPGNHVVTSAVTGLEIAIKQSLGKLTLPLRPRPGSRARSSRWGSG